MRIIYSTNVKESDMNLKFTYCILGYTSEMNL